MSDLVMSLIDAVELEAKAMANDLGSCAAGSALVDLVSHWKTQEVGTNDLINDYDSMLRELINLRLRLAYAVESQSSDLGDFEDDEKTTNLILGYVKDSWKLY